jgi:hypothetical protein
VGFRPGGTVSDHQPNRLLLIVAGLALLCGVYQVAGEQPRISHRASLWAVLRYERL